jgi:hypothetical protein
MKKTQVLLLAVVLFCLAAAIPALAQSDQLTLSLRRDFGYGGFSGDIQGTFTLTANGPAGLVKVEFFLDDQKLGEAISAPFKLQFVTDNYPAGPHTFSALGATADGKQLASNKLGATFLSASESSGSMLRIVGPILAVVFGAIAITAVISLVTGRKLKTLPPGTRRNYTLGGGICPKCGRPVAYSLFSINLVGGKLMPCPYCAKWSLFRRASLEKLRAAEDAELKAEKPQVPGESPEEKLRKELEDSKYQGM